MAIHVVRRARLFEALVACELARRRLSPPAADAMLPLLSSLEQSFKWAFLRKAFVQ